MDTTVIIISVNALSDHFSRLYDELDATTFRHVDNESAGTATVLKQNKKTCTVMMTRAAITEFIADMEYQVEFMDDPCEKDYRSQCKRALVSIGKQTAQ